MNRTLLSILAIPWFAASALFAAAPAKPNVVVMIVDDLGSGDVSCLFRNVVKTPNLDRLAASGVKFTSGYVPVPLCGPSRAGFFTGRYPQRFGFHDNLGGVPTDLPLLPGVLRDAGYRTAIFGKWHSDGPRPHARGCFDETLCDFGPFMDYHHPRLVRNGKPEKHDEYSTDLLARESEAFIDRNKENPFYLTVSFNAPHILKTVGNHDDQLRAWEQSQAAGKLLDMPKAPMARPGDAQKFAAQFPGDTARADTVATIVALDEAVGRILDRLKQNGLEKNTVVFFFSDNGAHPESRGENLPLRDYKWTTYEGGIRVPFLASYPGVFPAGVEFAHPVTSLDIFPTCARLAGVQAPANLDGVDLTPYLEGEKAGAPHETLYFTGRDLQGAVRQGQWKLVLPAKGAPQLFDLSKDVGEKNDLASAQPALVKELAGKWQAWIAQMPVLKKK